MTHSYTSLSTWLTCPAKYNAIYIDKRVKRGTSPALERGLQTHERLQMAVRTGVEPEGLRLPPKLIQSLHAAQAETEVCLRIREDGSPTTDKAASALVGYLDVLLQHQNRALCIDWKTGKFRPDMFQADVYRTLVEAHHATTSFEFAWVYTDLGRVHTVCPDAGATARVASVMWQVEADDKFRPIPGPLCRWCPVHECRYNTAEKSA